MLHIFICICQKPLSLPHHSEGRRGSIFENIRISFRVGLGLHWRSTAVCKKVSGYTQKCTWQLGKALWVVFRSRSLVLRIQENLRKHSCKEEAKRVSGIYFVRKTKSILEMFWELMARGQWLVIWTWIQGVSQISKSLNRIRIPKENHDFWKYKSVEMGSNQIFFHSIDTGWRFNNYWNNWWIIGWNEFQLNNFSLQKLETEKFFNSILYERS